MEMCLTRSVSIQQADVFEVGWTSAADAVKDQDEENEVQDKKIKTQEMQECKIKTKNKTKTLTEDQDHINLSLKNEPKVLRLSTNITYPNEYTRHG